MKKLHALIFCAIVCVITASSCMRNHDDGNISLNFKDSDRYYSMNAYFDKSDTRSVEQYMDSRIGRKSNMSFINSGIDGTIALDDHTTFYIKKSPGVLKIKLDKDKNSIAGYDRIKSMCEGIKHVLAK